jgi:hypothetical protein
MLRTQCRHLFYLAFLGTLPVFLVSGPALAEVKTAAILRVLLFNYSQASSAHFDPQRARNGCHFRQQRDSFDVDRVSSRGWFLGCAAVQS